MISKRAFDFEPNRVSYLHGTQKMGILFEIIAEAEANYASAAAAAAAADGGKLRHTNRRQRKNRISCCGEAWPQLYAVFLVKASRRAGALRSFSTAILVQAYTYQPQSDGI